MPPSGGRSERDETRARRSALLTVGITLATFFTSAGMGQAARVDFCRQTSKKADRACQGRAPSDYSLALAKCDNVADSAARKACQVQALADRNDAKQTCKDQLVARQTVCSRLGGAPYGPVIDPTNFVTTSRPA